jgi:hypothetical protein
LPNPPHSRSPLFSRASIFISLLVLSILGIALWIGGGSIFNPGPLSAKSAPGVELNQYRSHADFENQCWACHTPFQGDQAAQCLSCHQDINAQLAQKTGLHASLTQPRDCASCHHDHQGRDFDPAQAAMTFFDHSRTLFPLSGAHGLLDCQRCHTGAGYTALDTRCAACHAEPAAHSGMFGGDCAACHTTAAWRPATLQGKAFDHSLVGFTLNLHPVDFQQAPIQCTGCHKGQIKSQPAGQPAQLDPQPCVACHAAQAVTSSARFAAHIQQYGTACLACHDGVDRLHAFNHQVTFPLTGKHASLTCAGCHKNGSYRGASPQCAGCHQEPDLHAGFFGTRCDYCHTDQAWRPAPLHAHTFPLDHGGSPKASSGTPGAGSEVACQTCHPARYAAYTCDSCHAPADMPGRHASLKLSATELANCIHCHLNGMVQR